MNYELAFVQGNRRKGMSSAKSIRTCKLVVNTMRSLSCCSLLFLSISLASIRCRTNKDWRIQEQGNLAKIQFPLTLRSGALRTAVLWSQQLGINKRHKHFKILGIKNTESIHHKSNRNAYECALMEAMSLTVHVGQTH